jgi:stage III sporulation protein SpoIIIAA
VLRKLARLLSSNASTVVVVVDNTLEICGTDKVRKEEGSGTSTGVQIAYLGARDFDLILLSSNSSTVVVVVDTTLELCGTDKVTHRAPHSKTKPELLL